jgi:hypothetical protein
MTASCVEYSELVFFHNTATNLAVGREVMAGFIPNPEIVKNENIQPNVTKTCQNIQPLC